MSELYGWVGKILRVDIDSGKCTTEDTLQYVPQYIGGRGVATRIAWNELEPDVGPYDPENPLMFMTGPFTGTLVPTSGRGSVCGVSPRIYPTPWFTYGTMGGDWAAELKYAGFDAVIIKGNSSRLVYLWIHDGKAEILDAKEMAGFDTFVTQGYLKEKHGDQTQVACIGPAGENRVLWSTIQHRLSNSIGDAGLGAVMGAKKLKAIAIRGTGGVKIAKPEEFIKICRKMAQMIKGGPTNYPHPTLDLPYRNPIGPGNQQCSHGCPLGCGKLYKNMPAGITVGSGTRNMMSHCEDLAFIHGESATRYPTEEIKDTYDGDMYTRETKAFGDRIGTELQALCEGLGLTSSFPINYYPWFWVCIENGITQIEGFKLEPDKPQFWLDFMKKVAYREDGIGELFSGDMMRAADQMGIPPVVKKAAKFQFPMWGQPSHRQGRSYESQPSPLWINTMLHWIIDSRDPMACHHQSSFVAGWFPPHNEGKAGTPDSNMEKIKAAYKKAFGTAEGMEPGFENIDAKTRLAVWQDNRAQIKDSLLICDWPFPAIIHTFPSRKEYLEAEDYYGDIEAEAKMLAPLTGLDIDTEYIDRAGERIRNLDRAIHIRNYDRSREIDSTGEWYYEYPEKSDGTKLDMKMFNTILESYYAERGWDKSTGRPIRAKLDELGLKEVADELERIGKLPKA
jgi:aldehyde:ferredoxin oxidoreductase